MRQNRRTSEGGNKGDQEAYAGNFFNSAVQYGVNKLIKDNPSLGKYQGFLVKHIDYTKLSNLAEGFYLKMNDVVPDSKQGKEYWDKALESLSTRVANGEIFDNVANTTVLNKRDSKQKKGLLKLLDFSSGKDLEKKKNFDYVTSAFEDLYHLLQSGGYLETNPEIAKICYNMARSRGFGDTLNMLEEYQFVKKSTAKKWRGNLYQQVKREGKRSTDILEKYFDPKQLEKDKRDKVSNIQDYLPGAKEGERGKEPNLQDYLASQKVAAFFGIFGAGLLIFSKTGITGNIIGNNPVTNSLLGLFFIIIALLLFFIKKNKFKK